LITMGEAKDDLEQMVKEMRMEMKKTQTENKKAQENLKAKIFQMEKTQEDTTKKQEELKTKIVKLDIKSNDMESEISILREPPFMHTCGHKQVTAITSQTISYDSLFYSSTNTEGGGLDRSTGEFTCPYPGSYTISWSLVASDHAGDHDIQIYLRKNSQTIGESAKHSSVYEGPSGVVDDQGGRTLLMHLDTGDTLDLYCKDCSATIWDITFCVSLSTFDTL